MLKALTKTFVVVFAMMVVSGCTVRAYKQVRDRVDQDSAGNAGYLSGTHAPVDQSNVKKDRMTYVIEVTKKDKKQDEAVEAAMARPTTPQGTTTSSSTMSTASPIVQPVMDEPVQPTTAVEVPGVAPAAGSTYTVEKGDTLQKIAKKFYNSFAKWNKIYEANKDKIPNPNKIKAGTVLTIP